MDNKYGDLKANNDFVMPLTPGQHGFLFHALADEGNSNYHEQFICRFSRRVDVELFRWVIETLFSKHDCFRTHFLWHKGELPCQIVNHDILPAFYVVNIDSNNDKQNFPLNYKIKLDYPQNDDIEEFINQFLRIDLQYVFDLSAIPVRAYLIQLPKESVFVLAYHHIVMDGWSLAIFVQQLLTIYNVGQKTGIQDTDVITALPLKPFMQQIAKCQQTFQRDYWATYLQNLVPSHFEPLSLLTHSSDDLSASSVGWLETTLPQTINQKIQQLCGQYRITSASLFYVAWGVLLQRWLYSDDVVFGATFSGRNAAIEGIDSALGLFINTLPLRLKDDGSSSLIEYFQQMHDRLMGHYEHEYDSLAKIKQVTLQADYQGDLFDSLVVIENYPIDSSQLFQDGQIGIQSMRVQEQTHYPLSVSVINQTGFLIKIGYSRQYFTDRMAQTMFDHLQYLLEQIVDNPQCTLASLRNISPEQQQRYIQSQIDSMAGQQWDRQSNIIEQFYHVVESENERVAVVDEQQSLTYRQLADKADLIARFLIQQGIKVGDFIGIISERTIDTVAAIVGVMRAGAAYIPISSEYPLGRIQEIIDDSQLSILLVQQKKFDVSVKQYDLLTLPDAPVADFPKITRDDHAYMIYSSGSTGKPKGILVSHRGLLRIIQVESPIKLPTYTNTLLVSPFEFDASVYEVWATLINRGKLVLLSRQSLFDIDNMTSTIIEHNVSHALITTALLNTYIAEGAVFFTYLKHIISGGEPLSARHINQLITQYPHLQVVNGYGPTENTVFTTTYLIEHLVPDRVPIGYAAPGSSIYVVDLYGHLLPIGAIGELVSGGDGVALGYLNRPQLTETVFTPDPFISGGLMHKTGDYARLLDDGCVELFGRKDGQVKINGQRIEIEEITQRLLNCQGIVEAVVLTYTLRNNRHIGAVICVDDHYDEAGTQVYLTATLPSFALPQPIMVVDAIPKNHNGKSDLEQLRSLLLIKQQNKTQATNIIQSQSNLALALKLIWQQVLDLKQIDGSKSFFALGGTSLDIIRIKGEIQKQLGVDVDITDLFKYPTLDSLTAYLNTKSAVTVNKPEIIANYGDTPIAIVGMAGRFPGAMNIESLWQLVSGRESGITLFSYQELQDYGISPTQLDNSNYIKAKGVLDDLEWFDADFFGYTPNEAELMDPQIRLLHQCCWQVLEHAGCDPNSYPGSIGIFAGLLSSPYWLQAVLKENHDATSLYKASMLNVSAATALIAHALNLTGPTITLDTACSTSAVAIHEACNALRNGDCDAALAGGASIEMPAYRGYEYHEGMIHAKDATCRPFDSMASGTITGDGVAMVMLKRLDDAIKDRDSIYAVIKGSAVNNDGHDKVGYTAPSVNGQRDVICLAMKRAQFSPDSIGLVEAHGTATALGDPIEIRALNEVFGKSATPYCAVSAIKSNIGHLNAAAGVAGVIKTALALHYQELPPIAHFRQLNPAIDLTNSALYINSQLQPWVQPQPHRAMVSSFGIGGTNASIALENYRLTEDDCDQIRDYYLLPFSAKTATALDSRVISVLTHVKHSPNIRLPDVAYTLQTGRSAFKYRRAYLVSRGSKIDVASITILNAPQFNGSSESSGICFMFPGQGSQYCGMAKGLYESQPVFREQMDKCFSAYHAICAIDLKKILFNDEQSQDINQTIFTQPLLFSVEYSLAKTFIELGIKPTSMIGHSLGEYVAACLAGVFSLNDAIRIIEARGRLMQSMQPGSMLAVYLSQADLAPWLSQYNEIELAANNSECFCVVAGRDEAINAFAQALVTANIQHTRLKTSHAFHSAMMKPMLQEFAQLLYKISLHAPQIPFISNVSGDWITEQQTTSVDYWVQQVRCPVLFNDGATQLLTNTTLFVEIGPGKVLSTFVQGNKQYQNQKTIQTMRQAKVQMEDEQFLQHALATLWVNGANIDWKAFNQGFLGRRIALPGYPFEQSYYYHYGVALSKYRQMPHPVRRPKNEWLQRVVWQKDSSLTTAAFYQPSSLVIIIGDNGDWVKQTLALEGIESIIIAAPITQADELWTHNDINLYFQPLVEILQQRQYQQLHCIYLTPMHLSLFQSLSGLYRVAAWYAHNSISMTSMTFLTQGAFRILQDDIPEPAQAALSGAVNVLLQELKPTSVRLLDFASEITPKDMNILNRQTDAANGQAIMAVRDGVTYSRQIISSQLPPNAIPSGIQSGSVIWIIGGEKGIGRVIGEMLATRDGINVILSSRHAHQHQAPLAVGSKIMHCDITSADTVNACLTKILACYHRLDGVIFAAESTTALTLHQLTEPMLIDSLMVKGQGTSNLIQALEQQGLLDERLMLLFCNSLAAVNAEVGQLGYASVSAYLDALAEQLRINYGVNALSIEWDGLKEQGMLLDAINGSDNPYFRDLRPLTNGVLLQAYKYQGRGASYYTRLSPERHWLLNEHRIDGVATLPATGYLAMVYEAMRNYLAQSTLTINELVFLAPLQVKDGYCVDLFININPLENGFSIEVKSISDVFNLTLTTHAKGTASLLITPTINKLDREAKLQNMHDVSATIHAFTGDHFYYGERWQSLQQVYCNNEMTHALATLILPAVGKQDDMTLHPALLDIASGFIEQIQGFNSETVPFLYQQCSIYAAMTRTLYVEMIVNQHQSGEDHYTFTIYSDSGEVVLHCASLMKRKVQIQTLNVRKEQGLPIPCAENYQLQLYRKSSGESELLLQPTRRQAPADDEVEIEVLGSGINFKDVLFATGLLKQHPNEAPLQIGLECAGRIARIGKNVKTFAPGDDVMAIVQGGFCGYVSVNSHCVVHKPKHCRIEQAAVLPVAYLTAYYALVIRGNLKRGERVLIHSASGGVGLAAIYIAKLYGAQIYTTAGSEVKREYLASLGVECVADSHSDSFVTTIMNHSQGHGMDIILNSLTGELIDASLEILAPLGRFLELGSKDIVENRSLPMRFFAHGGTFIPINFHAAYGDIHRYLQQIVTWIDDKQLPLLPCTTVPLPEVRDAFAVLTMPQHVGKVALIHRNSNSMERINTMLAERRLGAYSFSLSNTEAMCQLRPLLKMRSPWAQLVISPRRVNDMTLGNRVYRSSISEVDDANSEQSTQRKRPRPNIGTIYQAPERDIEQELCRILEDYLGISNVGIDDHYEALGISSLDMVQLSGLIARHYPAVSVVTLYNHTTIRQLAKFCIPLDKESEVKMKTSTKVSTKATHRPNAVANRALKIAKNNIKKH
ncbi:colibactin hybrid non-ribosomal peptide synthetase/type I polyketide synthase ClbB [Gilliamella sp. App4-10]|uniref:colibactin hybrid non-ribosomal peptide synthetase/type I polyketide synthase ClbB n=1 Tax=Gilliamella sp. App4-10 TaxID=3120231 RepID=UPI00080E63C7|nr:colibactin hybrid non-ribosomal peptide synthetase/type I polyketide synthase ClbB [Gilliamella apicola]OCG21775.1 non-ribosomal peptide synthetase [Gilliamella apicola]